MEINGKSMENPWKNHGKRWKTMENDAFQSSLNCVFLSGRIEVRQVGPDSSPPGLREGPRLGGAAALVLGGSAARGAPRADHGADGAAHGGRERPQRGGEGRLGGVALPGDGAGHGPGGEEHGAAPGGRERAFGDGEDLVREPRYRISTKSRLFYAF